MSMDERVVKIGENPRPEVEQELSAAKRFTQVQERLFELLDFMGSPTYPSPIPGLPDLFALNDEGESINEADGLTLDLFDSTVRRPEQVSAIADILLQDQRLDPALLTLPLVEQHWLMTQMMAEQLFQAETLIAANDQLRVRLDDLKQTYLQDTPMHKQYYQMFQAQKRQLEGAGYDATLLDQMATLHVAVDLLTLRLTPQEEDAFNKLEILSRTITYPEN